MTNKAKIKQDADQYFESLIKSIKAVAVQNSADAFDNAARLILDAEANGNRLHFTGIGKPGHIAGYLASLYASTGTPAYFLDGTEAVHGSAGQVCPGDVVVAISNSGNTAELMYTIQTLKNNDARIIGVSGSAESKLAKASDVFLLAHVGVEGGPLNRAPRGSIMAELAVLQALSVAMQNIKDITPQQYVKWHPGGALGAIREHEK